MKIPKSQRLKLQSWILVSGIEADPGTQDQQLALTRERGLAGQPVSISRHNDGTIAQGKQPGD
jgi:hypothetical protein